MINKIILLAFITWALFWTWINFAKLTRTHESIHWANSLFMVIGWAGIIAHYIGIY